MPTHKKRPIAGRSQAVTTSVCLIMSICLMWNVVPSTVLGPLSYVCQGHHLQRLLSPLLAAAKSRAVLSQKVVHNILEMV